MQGGRSKPPNQFVPLRHYQKEIPYTDIRGLLGSIVPFRAPTPAQWSWVTEPRKFLSTANVEGDRRFFDTWIVHGIETDTMGKQYITLRSPNTHGLAKVSLDYLKYRWSGFQDEDKKGVQQKELVTGKVFILANCKKKLDDAEYKRWKAQNEKAKDDRKRRKSSAAVVGAA